MDMTDTLFHGLVGTHQLQFTELLPLRAAPYDVQALFKLSELMKSPPDIPKDGPDPEENVLVPAGYTYFGQFIDHDLTFDSTSSLNLSAKAPPTNTRTPRFDLDCVYGDGPAAMPYLYDAAGEKLLYQSNGPKSTKPTHPASVDLMRNPLGRAIIGDKRNDENSIVSQFQLAFIKYHNAVVDALKKVDPKKLNTPNDVFTSARNEVRWTYQSLVVKDFLKRIVKAEVFSDLESALTHEVRETSYALYTKDKRGNLPREFVAAAYRFGHSQVRTGYRTNAKTKRGFPIFPPSTAPKSKDALGSLVGFEPITNQEVIDHWGRFFPDSLPGVIPKENRSQAAGDKPNPAVRLQFAYKIDSTIVDPLGVLPRAQVAGEVTTLEAQDAIKPSKLPDTVVFPPRPSLALLNLLRGNVYRIQSGQRVAAALREKGLPVEPLDRKYLVVRTAVDDQGTFSFTPIDERLIEDTPLWFYILAEAQVPVVDFFAGQVTFPDIDMLTGPASKSQLGWVGGRIVAEVFYGLLDADPESFVRAAPKGWKPHLLAGEALIVRNLLRFADPSNA
jgi:hypothetical protein